MRKVFCSLLAISISISFVRHVEAMGGSLNSPSISVAAASGRDGNDWLAVLGNKKYKFVVGDFINSSTNLYYAGDTDSLNAFLADLVAVKRTIVRVSFSKESKTATAAFGGNGSPSGPCQWHIQHLGFTPEVFNVTIFLGDGKIDIGQLQLPDIQNVSSKPADGKPALQSQKR
jgi:hypothetical protein